MHLPKFTYFKPDTLEAAVSLLQTHDPDVRVVSGGTELFPRMKFGLDDPDILIGLKAIKPAAPMMAADNTLVVDALMPLSEVYCSELIRNRAPLLSEAAYRVASQEIRNMGTLGGNLCQNTRCLYYNQAHDFQFVEPCFKRDGQRCYFIPKGKKCWAVFMADTALALIALDAMIKVAGLGKPERIFPIEELYRGDALDPLTIGPNEIITKVRIPPQHPMGGAAFVKFSLRGAVEFAVLSAAVGLDLADDGVTCLQARIVVGAVSASPLHARAAESFLAGKALTEQVVDEAIESVSAEIRPVPHHGFSSAYLTACLRTQTRRALAAAVKGALN